MRLFAVWVRWFVIERPSYQYKPRPDINIRNDINRIKRGIMETAVNYEKFINDDFSIIQDEFNKEGYAVKDATDFATYKGWLDKGRKVKRGNKGLRFETSKTYPKPFYEGYVPKLDAKGRQYYRHCKKSFVLFHKEQTECISN